MAEGAKAREQSRRTFVDWILSRTLTTWLLSTSFGGLVLAIFYPAGRYLVPPPTGESAAASVTLPFGPEDVAPNSGQIFKMGNRAGLLIKTPAGELRAFEAQCTHLACIVQYREDLSRIWCACHNGHFDLNGRNIEGPPPRPLEEFEVNVRDDEIVVTKGA